MKLITCSECGEFHYRYETTCPHCNNAHQVNTSLKASSKKRRFAPNAILLGLALTGCGDKVEDTSSTEPASEPSTEASTEPTSEPAVENDYGVPDTGLTE